ncbi:MAG: leucine-rich repeat domain-containing protein [Bacteroidaceae bacterium]|nr:leucine-rich repeat domain-containing protein [Bacteroidaceae bacterium]
MKTKHLFLSLISFFVSITISSNELHTHELYVQPDACIDGIYYKFYETEAKVTYERLEIDPSTLTDIIYTNYTGNVDIPEFVEYNGITYKVTSISNDAFRGCSSLYTINIPNTVTTIGYNAFRDCTNLTFTIPNSVTSIGGNAFLNTPWYNGQPNGMVYVGNVAYCYKGSGLQNISLRDGTLSIACNAFRNCTDLRTITIPESVTEIGEYAFANCSSLTSISIPGNVTSIGWSAFAECSKITSITIPNGVTKLEQGLFEGCSQLNTIILPDNLVFIGSGAFQFCSSLESIAIPEGVTSIGGSAFRSCTSLTSLTIPNGVTCIDGQTFQNCSSLTSITIPNSVTSIEYQAFEGCTSLTSVTINIENPLSIDDGQTFSNSANATLYVPYGCKAAYEAAPYWRNFAEIIEMPNPNSITVGSTGFATFCSPKAMDFSGVTDIKAYIASGFSPSAGTLVLTRVTEVPAGEGLYIVGTPGSYVIPETTTDMVYSNLLKGVTTPTTISPTEGSYTNFILTTGIHGVGFYTLSTTGELAAGKAYLQLPTASFANIKALNIVLDDDDDATGITEIQDIQDAHGVIYNLAGQRVNKAQKGLYIINGKKTLIK